MGKKKNNELKWYYKILIILLLVFLVFSIGFISYLKRLTPLESSLSTIINIAIAIFISYYLTRDRLEGDFRKNNEGEAKKAHRQIDSIGDKLKILKDTILRNVSSIKQLPVNNRLAIESLLNIYDHMETITRDIIVSTENWEDMLPDEFIEANSKARKEYFDLREIVNKIKGLENKKMQLEKEIKEGEVEKDKAQQRKSELDGEIEEKKKELTSIEEELKEIAPKTSIPLTFSSSSSSSTSSSLSFSSSSSSSKSLSHDNCDICQKNAFLNECDKCHKEICDDCFDPLTGLCKKCSKTNIS